MKYGKKMLVFVVICLVFVAGLFVESKAQAANIKKDGEYHLEFETDKLSKSNAKLTSSAMTLKNSWFVTRTDESGWKELSYKSYKFKVNSKTKFYYYYFEDDATKKVSKTTARKILQGDIIYGEGTWEEQAGVNVTINVKNGVVESVMMEPFWES